MIALSEARSGIPRTTSERDNQRLSEAARAVGFDVYKIPSDFDEFDTVEDALAAIPAQPVPTPTVWIGFIPVEFRYQDVWSIAHQKNLILLNNPDEHLAAMEFARSYPEISSLTAESVVIDRPEQWRFAANQLGYPVFVRGSVRSRKGVGWNACVATDAGELEVIVYYLFAAPFLSRGKVLIRRLLRLRHVRKTDGGFPMGREFRVFLYRSTVLCYGYYWDGEDVHSQLTPDEEEVVLNLARLAATRTGTPFIAVDVGQLESLEWIVIEVGDANFAGCAQASPERLWQRLRSEVEASNG